MKIFKILVFILIIFWLVKNDGYVTIDWFRYTIELRLFFLILIVFLLIIILIKINLKIVRAKLRIKFSYFENLLDSICYSMSGNHTKSLKYIKKIKNPPIKYKTITNYIRGKSEMKIGNYKKAASFFKSSMDSDIMYPLFLRELSKVSPKDVDIDKIGACDNESLLHVMLRRLIEKEETEKALHLIENFCKKKPLYSNDSLAIRNLLRLKLSEEQTDPCRGVLYLSMLEKDNSYYTKKMEALLHVKFKNKKKAAVIIEKLDSQDLDNDMIYIYSKIRDPKRLRKCQKNPRKNNFINALDHFNNDNYVEAKKSISDEIILDMCGIMAMTEIYTSDKGVKDISEQILSLLWKDMFKKGCRMQDNEFDYSIGLLYIQEE